MEAMTEAIVTFVATVLGLVLLIAAMEVSVDIIKSRDLKP